MFTPQQIEQVAFENQPFNGYSKRAVDEFLEPLTEDYKKLYKENALLKSKMRVLVSKLEEYRDNEASMKDAIVNAQKTCDKMVKDAEAKCAQMLGDANAAAAESARNADTRIAEEKARVEEAKRLACERIDALKEQLRGCMKALDEVKAANRPKPQPKSAAPIFDYDRQPDAKPNAAADAMADEISSNLEALVGTTVDTAPKAEPRHPVSDTSMKFANLQFGRNYEPGKRG